MLVVLHTSLVNGKTIELPTISENYAPLLNANRAMVLQFGCVPMVSNVVDKFGLPLPRDANRDARSRPCFQMCHPKFDRDASLCESDPVNCHSPADYAAINCGKGTSCRRKCG